MPNAASAADWLRDAERFAAAQRALQLLEPPSPLEPSRPSRPSKK